MLTIENIGLIQSKFAGTPEWRVYEVYISENSYVFQIRKRVGEWIVDGVKHNEMTIHLNRNVKIGNDGYIMTTAFIKQNSLFQSLHTFDEFRTLTSFTRCMETHINVVL
jgi:hypothetical protein